MPRKRHSAEEIGTKLRWRKDKRAQMLPECWV
jgi:hypothetical protein